MGTGNADYSKQINAALAQANLPKSDFAQQYSGYFQGGQFGQALQGLLNAGSLGNASPFGSGQYNVPGSVMNYNQPTTGPSSSNPSSINPNNNGPNYSYTPQTPYINAGSNFDYAGLNSGGGNGNNQAYQTPNGSAALMGPYGQSIPGTSFTYGQAAPGGGTIVGSTSPWMGPRPGQNGQSINDKGQLVDASGNVLVNPGDNIQGTYGPGQWQYNNATYQGGPLNNGFSSIQNGQWIDASGNPTGIPNGQSYNPGGINGGNIPNGYNPAGGNGIGANGFPISQATPGFGQLPSAYQSLLQQVSPGSGLAAPVDNSSINPQNSQYFQAIQQALSNQYNQSSKNLEAQFGASGGAGRGTPAAFAQAQLAAQALPQLQSALGSAYNQDFQNQLAQRTLQQQGNLANASNLNQFTLGAQGLNQQGGNLALQNLLGSNSLQNNLSQFNTGQSNSLTQQYLQMIQSANQQQIQNQLSGYQNFASLAASLAGAGTPGGSANVNLGAQSQSTLQQLGGLL